MYTASLVWSSLEALVEHDDELLELILTDESSEQLFEYLDAAVPGETRESLDAALTLLTHMAQKVTRTLPNDFQEMLLTVKQLNSKPMQRVFTPKDARLIIDAFEKKELPELPTAELFMGVYLVLKTGERAFANLDVLETLIAFETPAVEEYESQLRAQIAAEQHEADA